MRGQFVRGIGRRGGKTRIHQAAGHQQIDVAARQGVNLAEEQVQVTGIVIAGEQYFYGVLTAYIVARLVLIGLDARGAQLGVEPLQDRRLALRLGQGGIGGQCGIWREFRIAVELAQVIHDHLPVGIADGLGACIDHCTGQRITSGEREIMCVEGLIIRRRRGACQHRDIRTAAGQRRVVEAAGSQYTL